MRVEAIFGGALALFVLGVALYAFLRQNPGPVAQPDTSVPPPQYTDIEPNPLCECWNDAFDLAASDVGVMSSQYRTGFEICRARLGQPGADAWTAGWNARLSSRPHEASCRAYLRG